MQRFKKETELHVDTEENQDMTADLDSSDDLESEDDTEEDMYSLVSSYDDEVAKTNESINSDPSVRQMKYMQRLNRFHKEAITKMYKKSTANFA